MEGKKEGRIGGKKKKELIFLTKPHYNQGNQDTIILPTNLQIQFQQLSQYCPLYQEGPVHDHIWHFVMDYISPLSV